MGEGWEADWADGQWWIKSWFCTKNACPSLFPCLPYHLEPRPQDNVLNVHGAATHVQPKLSQQSKVLFLLPVSSRLAANYQCQGILKVAGPSDRVAKSNCNSPGSSLRKMSCLRTLTVYIFPAAGVCPQRLQCSSEGGHENDPVSLHSAGRGVPEIG